MAIGRKQVSHILSNLNNYSFPWGQSPGNMLNTALGLLSKVRGYITQTLVSLCWLNVDFIYIFKISLAAFNAWLGLAIG